MLKNLLQLFSNSISLIIAETHQLNFDISDILLKQKLLYLCYDKFIYLDILFCKYTDTLAKLRLMGVKSCRVANGTLKASLPIFVGKYLLLLD